LILRTPWIPGHKSHIRGCLCQDCTNLPWPKADFLAAEQFFT
jgi:hypothetical protein